MQAEFPARRHAQGSQAAPWLALLLTLLLTLLLAVGLALCSGPPRGSDDPGDIPFPMAAAASLRHTLAAPVGQAGSLAPPLRLDAERGHEAGQQLLAAREAHQAAGDRLVRAHLASHQGA
jgi:hypothetical protein